MKEIQLDKIYLITKYTFIDLYKSRILVNCLFLGLMLLGATIIASEFTYGTPQKIALDFGLGVTSISTVGIAIFMGVSLIAKDIESRTIYLVLSRNIGRSDFILGKILGLISILMINIAILFSLTTLFFIFLGGSIDSVILFSVVFSSIEAITCLLFVVLFSLVTNSVLSVVFTICVYITSYTIPYAVDFSEKIYPMLSKVLNMIGFLFPGFHNMNIKGHVLYKEFLSTEFLLKNLTIGSTYIIGMLLLITFIFNEKSLD